METLSLCQKEEGEEAVELAMLSIREMTPERRAEALERMAPERRARALRFRHDDDAARTLAGELLARELAGRLCRVPPESVRIAAHESGQPYAVGLPVCVSIAHAGEYAVCAADSLPIGVDIERLRPLSIAPARRFCDEEELRWLAEADCEAERSRRFLTLWTLREAYGKATGRGVLREMKKIAFTVTPQGVSCWPRPGGDDALETEPCAAQGGESSPEFRFSLRGDIPGYIIAVCEAAHKEA